MEAVAQPFRMVNEGLLLRPGAGWGARSSRRPRRGRCRRAPSGGNAVGFSRWALLRDQPKIRRELAEEIACGSRCIGDDRCEGFDEGGGAHGCKEILQKAVVEGGCGVAGERGDKPGLGAAGDGLFGHDKQGAAGGVFDRWSDSRGKEGAIVRHGRGVRNGKRAVPCLCCLLVEGGQSPDSRTVARPWRRAPRFSQAWRMERKEI